MTEKALVTQERSIERFTPQELVEVATSQAKLLMNIVEQTHCYQEIATKKYLQVEAWETIGAFNRVNAQTDSISPIVVNGETIGYRARVLLYKDGVVVGGAEMPCFFTENACKGKEGDAKHKACMSAAQTFATSKAYRMNYSYVAILAGYQPLPAEEITEDMRADKAQEAEHWCTIHNVAYQKHEKNGQKWYSHKTEDGKYCNERKAEPEPPKQPSSASPAPKVENIPEPLKGQPEGKQGQGMANEEQLKTILELGHKLPGFKGKTDDDIIRSVCTSIRAEDWNQAVALDVAGIIANWENYLKPKTKLPAQGKIMPPDSGEAF